MNFDYGIVGGGPAGYTLAIFLAKQGKNIVLFEKNKIGGTCLNKGCIPTKTLLSASEFYSKLTKPNPYNIEIEIKNFNFETLMNQKDTIIEKIRKNLELSIKNLGITIIYAEAKVIDSKTIEADNKIYKTNSIICATGSKPKEIKGLEFDNEFILNSDDILNLTNLPKEIVIVGSGAIGIEYSRIFSNFGCQVHLIELAEHLIPIADIDISKRIERIFKQNKINLYLNDSINSVQNKTITLKSGKILQPDFVLVAVGRTPNKKFENCTNIGDVNGELQLAHYAIQQAKEFINIAKCNKNLIPSVIYGTPEIAWVGLREQDVDETYNKVMLPITALGKAWCENATEGFIKIIEKDNKIVGAHIISKEASALIQQIIIAMQNDISINKLKEICFAHPTYSEGVFEAICKL